MMCFSSNEAVTIGTPPSRLAKDDVDRTFSVSPAGWTEVARLAGCFHLLILFIYFFPSTQSAGILRQTYDRALSWWLISPGPLIDVCPSLILDSLPALEREEGYSIFLAKRRR